MRIKKISAKNLTEGKALVRRELGGDAVILSTRNLKDSVTGEDILEIVAAIDEQSTSLNSTNKLANHNSILENKGLDEFISQLRYPLLGLLNPNLKKIYIELRNIGFEDSFITTLISEQTQNNNYNLTTDEYINLIINRLNIENLFTKKISRKIYGFVGPEGSGKTSSLLKFASMHQLMHSSKILVINADTYNFGSDDLLAAYCKLLNLNFKKVTTKEELDKIIDESKNFDLILIDYDSKSNYINNLIENILILPVYGNKRFLENQLAIYSNSYIALTGIDKNKDIQLIVDLLISKNLKLCFFTEGSKIPDDINLVDINDLKKLIYSND